LENFTKLGLPASPSPDHRVLVAALRALPGTDSSLTGRQEVAEQLLRFDSQKLDARMAAGESTK
jgi:hypothetical protein